MKKIGLFVSEAAAALRPVGERAIVSHIVSYFEKVSKSIEGSTRLAYVQM